MNPTTFFPDTDTTSTSINDNTVQVKDHKVEYLSSLTALRGIAALLVAVFHFEMAAARFVPQAQSMFFEKCYLMVDLFFIMSGFIMLHVYSKDFTARIQGESLKKFFVARFARVYPLHLFSTLLLVVIVRYLTDWGNPPILLEQPSDILPNILLLHSFGFTKIYSWNIPSWSISAEFAAYLLFPFLALFLNRKRLIAVLLLAVFVVAAYYSIMFVLPRTNPINPAIPVPHNLNTTFDYGYIRGIAGFITGMLVYLAYGLRSFKKVFSGDFASILLMLGVGLSLHYALNDGITVLLFAMLVLSVAANTGNISTFFNTRVMQFLGDISYSIYLMQIFLQEPFSHGYLLPGTVGVGRGRQNIDLSSGLLYCLIYLVLLIFISYVTYRWLERPCRRFINRAWGK
jgi:peptidoglycan/LPS O-acetylase OafA/YrhL